MKYILNKTPIRTSNNFKINDFEIDFDMKETDFNKYEISNVEYTEQIKSNFDNKIGLKSDKYYNINVNINEDIQDIILIKYNFSFDNSYLASQLNINLKKDTTSKIIILFESDIESFNNSKIVIDSSNNSTSDISIINLLSKDSKSFLSIENYENENSNININFIDIGGNLRVSNYYCKLNQKNSINEFNNIYIGNNNDRIDMNYYIANIGENSNSNMVIQGCLNNNSFKTFKGTIDFIKGCSKSNGDEIENCIMLSDTCKSSSLPMLLCNEEDVTGSHGVSTGKIDENKLFYLMAKGISEKDAKKLIITANFDNIINKIIDEKIKSKVQEEINIRI